MTVLNDKRILKLKQIFELQNRIWKDIESTDPGTVRDILVKAYHDLEKEVDENLGTSDKGGQDEKVN